jgi:hypothetical protein
LQLLFKYDPIKKLQRNIELLKQEAWQHLATSQGCQFIVGLREVSLWHTGTSVFSCCLTNRVYKLYKLYNLQG